MLLRKFCICYFKYCCFCIIKSNTIFKPVKIRLISQLIKGLSSVLQKLLKYFNGGTIISTFYVSSSTVNKVLLSTAWKLAIGLAIVKASLSLYLCHKLSYVFETLSLYSIKLYIGLITSMYLSLSICVLFILLMHSVNGAQFLNATFLPTFSVCLVLALVQLI